MKHLRRIASLLLAVVLVLALSVGAFADDDPAPTPTIPTSGTNDNSGKITINDAVVGQKYDIYQVLKLESYDTTAGAYAYKATTAWADFVTSTAIKDVYLKTDDNGYVTWVGAEDAERVATFAKLALEHAKTNSITATKTATATTTTVEFKDLNLGYYLIDSTLGMLCSLDTTNPTVTMEEKNEVPTNAKKVKEDAPATGTDEWGEKNDADIGQTVNFQSTITAQPGAENYVFHDKMSSGLTFSGTVTVTAKGATDTSATTLIANTDYTLKTTSLTDDCTFEIAFAQTYLNTIDEATTIVVSYSATLNENAVIAGSGNPNESKLSYGDSTNTKTTVASTTTTYTWPLTVFKYKTVEEEQDGQKIETKQALAGAKFVLSRTEKATDAISFVDVSTETDKNVYRVATSSDQTTVKEITTDATGKFKFIGLDADTYYLIETVAPAGFNILTGPIKVVITDARTTTPASGTVTYYGCTKAEEQEDKSIVYTYATTGSTGDATYGDVLVENKSGAELPSTGGMGTTMFYVLGSVLALGAVVLLVTRKRMSKNH